MHHWICNKIREGHVASLHNAKKRAFSGHQNRDCVVYHSSTMGISKNWNLTEIHLFNKSQSKALKKSKQWPWSTMHPSSSHSSSLLDLWAGLLSWQNYPKMVMQCLKQQGSCIPELFILLFCLSKENMLEVWGPAICVTRKFSCDYDAQPSLRSTTQDFIIPPCFLPTPSPQE